MYAQMRGMSFSRCFHAYCAAKAEAAAEAQAATDGADCSTGTDAHCIIDAARQRYNWPFLLRFLRRASHEKAVSCNSVTFCSEFTRRFASAAPCSPTKMSNLWKKDAKGFSRKETFLPHVTPKFISSQVLMPHISILCVRCIMATAAAAAAVVIGGVHALHFLNMLSPYMPAPSSLVAAAAAVAVVSTDVADFIWLLCGTNRTCPPTCLLQRPQQNRASAHKKIHCKHATSSCAA